MSEILTERKREIREVAQNLFREKGYAGTSVRDIARGMGMEAASLYNHMSSKEELLQQICFSMADEFYHELENLDGSLSAEKQLRDAIAAHIRVILRNLEASHVFFHEWVYLNEENLKRFRSLRSGYERKFRDILQLGMDKKLFAKRDIRLSVFTLFGAMNALHEQAKHLKGRAAKEIVDTMTEILMNGIKR